MDLSKYFRTAVLIPSVVVVLAVFVFSLIENLGYTSEWLTSKFGVVSAVAMAVFVSLLLIFFSLPIFLNSLPIVRNKVWLSALAWFLFPMGMLLMMVIHEIRHAIQFDTRPSTNELIYELLLILPFACGLIYSYRKFRKEIYRDV